jgi:hypothetical protein
MKRISDFFYKKTNLFYCIALTAIMILYAVAVLGGKSKCFTDQLTEGQKVLGLKMNYSYDYAFGLFNSLDNGGLLCYKNLILIWDNIFPLIYGLMYILWISFIYRNIDFKNQSLKLLNIFPFIHILMDWIENRFEINLVNQFIISGSLKPESVELASVISLIKWSCSYLTYLIILTGLVLIIFKKIKKS